MKIDLRQGLTQDRPAAVSGTVELQLPAEMECRAPATFTGTCLCLGEGAYAVSGTLCFVVEGACARCTRPAKEKMEVPFEERFEAEPDPEGDAFPLEGDFLVPDQALVQCALMALPYRLLCKPDCKGLCPVCGADRNETDCSCELTTDNPFSILRKLDLPEEV